MTSSTRRQTLKALCLLAALTAALSGCDAALDSKNEQAPATSLGAEGARDMKESDDQAKGQPLPQAIEEAAPAEAEDSAAEAPSAPPPSQPMKDAKAKASGAERIAQPITPKPLVKTPSDKDGDVLEDPVAADPSSAEDFKNYGVNPFVDPAKDKLSTFSIDVDTGAYTIARRKLQSGGLPPAAAVRVEEFVNFFRYDYKQPDGALPFNVDFEAAPSPFATNTVLMRVGVQGRTLSEQERKAAHLVFLVDTSGSMQAPDKLPLAQKALHLLVNQLKAGDTVALCTYAGSVTEVLAPTGMDQRARIHQAIEDLVAGGSTAMADGLETAYKLAYKTLKPGDVNRIIVLSDGDANVGQSSHEDILKRIEHYTKEGVTVSTIGFGMGNYKDTNMEQLANKGNGNYAYIDTFKQADRLFRQQLGATLQVIAKDVKIQVEFNPEAVEAYRLLGYENRDIADKDFRNDAVDAGEIGAGHSVTAIYELKMKPGAKVDPANVRIRHKAPDAGKADESTFAFSRELVRARFEDASVDFRVATMAAAFAEKLRQSPHASSWQWSRIRDLTAAAARNDDERELLALIDTARKLNGD